MELFDCDELCAANQSAARETAAAHIVLDDLLEQLAAISPAAYDEALHALLYGYADHAPSNPPLMAIKCFMQKVIAAAEAAGNIASEEARRRAEQLRLDRLDPDTEQVHNAAYKVLREFDRLRGLLRFKPEAASAPESAPTPEPDAGKAGGEFCYTARCAPDHFVLPLLAEHFWRRFGGEAGSQSWAIIDEKRSLALISRAGGKPVLRQSCRTDSGRTERRGAGAAFGTDPIPNRSADEWEGLWKNYHHAINNKSRANAKLQKQFMPRRYWKYLTEME